MPSSAPLHTHTYTHTTTHTHTSTHLHNQFALVACEGRAGRDEGVRGAHLRRHKVAVPARRWMGAG